MPLIFSGSQSNLRSRFYQVWKLFHNFALACILDVREYVHHLESFSNTEEVFDHKKHRQHIHPSDLDHVNQLRHQGSIMHPPNPSDRSHADRLCHQGSVTHPSNPLVWKTDEPSPPLP